MTSLVWFRNDLRVHDNPALHAFLEDARSNKSNSGAIVFISKKQWRLHDWSEIKIDLYIRHTQLLKKHLSNIGIDLNIVEADLFEDQIKSIASLTSENSIETVFANSEPEINEVNRDQTCIDLGVPLKLFESDVIVPKGKVLNKSGEMFKVFTPFKKAWLERIRAIGFEYLGKPESLTTAEHGHISCKNDEVSAESDSVSSGWPLVSIIESQVIPSFLSDKLHDYAKHRDFPSIKGTSGLSPYLAIGALSPRYLLVLLLNRMPDLLDDMKSERFTWLNELIWRDFYRHLIFHFPNLCKHQAFNQKYLTTQWPNDNGLFEAWCEGKTGYPIVDAAMRQLNTTGWMHNRLRMVVASFLTKHLLIDWRWGEKYFMSRLIDGDLAANNGGWQWAASTGCDAQPYFRIFNPMLQSKKFDPDGEFIRKYLPELKDVSNKDIHFPHAFIEAHSLGIYWPAVVDHKQARLMALDFYK